MNDANDTNSSDLSPNPDDAEREQEAETAEDIARRYIPGFARQVGVTTGWFD
jgi:hypothetical protein